MRLAPSGMITCDGYPSYYVYQPALQPQFETLLTPDALFTQDLSIGTGNESFVQSFVTIRGLLTSIPLGQGMVDESATLVLSLEYEGTSVFLSGQQVGLYELSRMRSAYIVAEVKSARIPGARILN